MALSLTFESEQPAPAVHPLLQLREGQKFTRSNGRTGSKPLEDPYTAHANFAHILARDMLTRVLGCDPGIINLLTLAEIDEFGKAWSYTLTNRAYRSDSGMCTSYKQGMAEVHHLRDIFKELANLLRQVGRLGAAAHECTDLGP